MAEVHLRTHTGGVECVREIIHVGRFLTPDNQRLHEADARTIPHNLAICYIVRPAVSEWEHAMKAFVAACLAAVALAAIGLVGLNHVQEPVDHAFATPYARVG